MGTAIGYLDGRRLRRSLLAAAAWVVAGRDELNRINVYPVPDGDTGTNFSHTVRSIADALHRLGDAPELPDVTRTAAEASVKGARGNSGMMLSHFLLGFSEGIGQRMQVRTHELAAAIRRGFERLQEALEKPVEGTILSVAREAARGAERGASEHSDIVPMLRTTLAHADEALQRTPEQLPVLKEAGVVDAGGKGFVRLLEGVVRLIEKGMHAAEVPPPAGEAPAPAALATVAAEQDYRFCTEVLVKGDRLPSSHEARVALAPLGGSLLALRTADLLRVHIHTDDAAAVFRIAESWGEVVTRKADDMREQHRLLTTAARRVAIVCDSACDLPDAVLDRYGIALVPLQVLFGDEVRLDRVELAPAEFYRRLRAGGPPPTTSQPTPAQFVAAFEHARAEAEGVVAVLLSSALSGTYASAEAARRSFAAGGVHLVDSRSASFGIGLLALRGAELAEAGWDAAAIARELERVRDRSGMFCTVDTLHYLLRSGRVSRVQAWLGGLLDMKPILSLDGDGKVVAAGRVRGQAALLERVCRLLDAALPRTRVRLRLAVAHADTPELAERVRRALAERYQPLDVLVAPVTGVLAAHVGPGAWGVFYQVEDAADDGNLSAAGRL
ncbi:MAG TPA: DegV family protein [Gemmatimonadales bacterium]|nr:DegV family protein [Gemmatimonadales bacterium]